MKVSKFLLMAILGTGLALSSCNNEVVTDDENDQGGGDSYMSMTLEFPEQGASTYAEEAGDGDEVDVKNVKVVFFDATTNIVSEVADFVIGDLTQSGTKYTTKAIKLNRGNYDVVALINIPSSFITITKGSTTKTDFETAATITSADDLANGTTGFFMTNATSYKRVNSTNFQPTETAATGTPVPLKVERAVAKVVVMKSSGMTVTGGTVADADINWAVDIKNGKTYWMRKQTNKLEQPGGVGTPWIAGAMEVEADYTTTGREYLYAEDPNFSGHGSAEAADFTKIGAVNISKALSTSSTPGAGYVSEYVPENTMPAADQFRNVSTSVAIKIVYEPTGITDAKTVGYYTFNGTVISDADMKGYAADHSTIPASLPGLGDILTEYSGNLTTTPGASFTFKSLSFYKNGISYFNVPIKHFSLQTTLMAYGRYGVVRNNVYKLTINSIKGPGKVEPSAEDWQDDEESFISVEFDIMPWYVREQGIEL